MCNNVFHLAFIGPGGPEFIMVMLVLLLMFGAKDAPRIFRKINEMLNQLRNTADSFKREIMYGDLNKTSNTTDHENYSDDDEGHDYDYDHDHQDEEYMQDDLEQDYSDETFENLEKDLEAAQQMDATDEPAEESDVEEESDAEKI